MQWANSPAADHGRFDWHTDDELAAIVEEADRRGEAVEALLSRLGPPIDIFINDNAYWRSVPTVVWNLAIGGYQVFKKWLSYREASVLGRSMTPDEVREGAAIVRRLTAIVLMTPELDANYETCRANPLAKLAIAGGTRTAAR